jgi:hypothetical protein
MLESIEVVYQQGRAKSIHINVLGDANTTHPEKHTHAE